jgi:transglutaminase-like putative cysteine protease
MRLTLACCGLLVLVPGFAAQEAKLDPAQPYIGRKSEPVTYKVDLSAVVTPPYKCKVLKVWMPIPPSDEIQETSGSTFSTFPMKVAPMIGVEKVYGNKFAYFEFTSPQGAQIIRHRFTVKTHQVEWNVDPAKVSAVKNWPSAFESYLRSEKLIPTDGAFKKLAVTIVPAPSNPARDLKSVMDWVNQTMVHSHTVCSLTGSAVFALEKKTGHCSDYHGLCTALSRALGYPTRIAYGINPYPKNSPSHCKLEAYLPPYGWVCFDVSDTQILIAKIMAEKTLDAAAKDKLAEAARNQLASGFRDNTWFMQTRGSGYDLEPPAKNKAAVVRTVYVEADGEALAEPDPADLTARSYSWMTVHHYEADRQVTNPFQDWRSLLKK